METIKQKLGKVSITVDKDEHSLDKEYDKLVVVYKKTAYTETVNGETVTKYNYRTYISRKPVPIGTEITNDNYWIQLGSVEEHIVLDYETFKAQVNAFLNSFVDAEEARVLAENNRVSAENIRITNENTRKSNENIRKDQEDARQEAETVRQQQEGSPADEPSSTGSRWARYKKAEQIRDSSYSDKEDNRDASYASSEQTRNNSYNTAEGQKTDIPNSSGSRWAQYKANENQRQQDYEANEGNKDLKPERDGSRWERYKQAEVDREDEFKSNEDSRDGTFTNSERQRQTTFNNNEGTVNDTPSSTGSRWARFKFNEASRQTAEQTRVTNENTRQTQETSRQQAESQRTSTFNQSQTERQQAYENAEGTSSDEPSATGSRWARYNKAEQDRNAEIEDLRENKANKDGYYSQMTVGAAETLVGETVDSADYLIRPTGGESNEVANSVASVIGMEGHTEKFNQLVRNGNFENGAQGWYIIGGTLNVSDNIATINATASTVQLYRDDITKIVSHPHLYAVTVKFKNNGTVYFSSGTNSPMFGTTGEWQTIKYIDNHPSGVSYPRLTTTVASSGDTIQVSSFNVFDLTAMFGAGNEPSTVEEFEAWLAEHVGTKPYYGYNAGTILSAQTLGIKTYGQNLLNPTTRQAKLIPYEWEENSNVYTIKNVPSGATATFTPDATGVAESITITNNKFDITSYGSGILELSAATAETYVCMKWDEQKDDDVVPFEEHTQNFDVRKVYGKVNGAGEYVWCFPNGLKGIGSVKDTLNASEAVSKIGSVDLGDLSWSIYSSTTFISPISGLPSAPNTGSTNHLCSKYTVKPADGLSGDKFIAIGLVNVVVKDTSYSDAATFQTAMSGVPLYYELATPITYTDLVYRDGGIDRPLTDVLMNIEVNNWSIEEQMLTPYVDGNPTSVPAKISTQYGMDAVEEIDTIKHTYVSAYSEQNFSDSQKAQARRNIGAVEADGTYPNMSVGIAKNLAGENAVEAEYTYRQSGGTTGTNTGIANVTAVKGKTLKWNQLINDIGSISSDGITFTKLQNGQVHVYGTANATSECRVAGNMISGHKYFVKGCPAGGSQSTYRINYYFGGEIGSGQIFNCVQDVNSYPRIQVFGGVTLDVIFTPILIDLTQMFGAGNEPSTVTEFEALYPLDYYAYTATPVLINNAASGIETTGFNQWDEEWDNIESSRFVHSKNYIPVFHQEYFLRSSNENASFFIFEYDKNFTQLRNPFAISPNSTYTPQAACKYIKFRMASGYGTTYNNDICINLSDPAKNGTYEPYEKHTFYFDKVLQGEGSLATVKGKLNGDGESVVVFPDGLKRVGTVYDEIKGNVAIKRVGSVDLGTLTWTKHSGGYFYSNVINTPIPTTTGDVPNILCSKYLTSDNYTIVNKHINNFISIGRSGMSFTQGVIVMDSSYADADAFKTAMNGVILYYELATPETYILDQTVTGGYQVNALGTEQRLPEDTASAVNAPVSYSVIYPIDAVGTITKLPINYISEGSLTNFTTELASKLGTFLNATIGISATYNQTTQEYDYSITITSNE